MKLITAFSIFILSFSSFVSAQVQELDKVAVIVDQTVVLESEIQDLLATVKANAIRNNQNLPNDRVLRTQAIERLINEALQMQMAQRMGIQVSDPQLEQTIRNFASSENLSAEQLRAKVESEGMDWEQYRERIRKELITGEVTRANVRRRIYVTPQEVSNMVSLIDEQGAEEVEFQLGHILVGFPSEATQEDIDAAKERSQRVLELLQKNDADFRKIATTASSGPRALEGGDLGWMNVNTMPTLFAEVVADAKKDELIGPIRSGAGFHILKILDIRGKQVAEIEEVNARHILIQPSVILSEERAQQMLSEFKNQVINEEAEFSDLAREHSKDPGSAARGGELGWNDPSIYVPAFKETLAELTEPGELSEPFRSVHGWHLVQLIGKRIGDVTDKLKEEKAYQLLFQRKFGEEREAWIREMRDQAYVEVLE